MARADTSSRAQRSGREKWYEYYKLEVAEIIRDNRFDRAKS